MAPRLARVRSDLYRYWRVLSSYVRDPHKLADEVASARRRKEVRACAVEPLCPTAAEGLPVVVSLTSYGSRIERVDLAIRSIMLQTVRPNRVILWLGEESGDVVLPPRLMELVDRGLEVRRGVRDLKGHKKYYFAMQELEDCLLVTIDDDLVYTPDVIESLLAAHELRPHDVVARRTHRIVVADGQVAPYLDWEMEFEEDVPRPRRSLLATTGAGTLYPPELFGRLVGNADDIVACAWGMDDLWLKALEVHEGIDVAYAPNSRPMPYVMPFSQGGGLLYTNKVGGNDEAMRRLMRHFSLCAEDFVDE